MKFISSIVLLIGLSVLVSCENEEGNPQKTTFLTVNLNSSFMESAKDKWVFATDEEGELLAIERLEAGTTFQTLETNKPFNTFDLTVFTVYEIPATYTFYSMETYKAFPANETIALGVPVTSPAAIAGNAAITITNYSEALDPRANVKFSTKPYGSTGVFSPSYSGTTYSVSAPLYQGFNKIHIYGLRGNMPVYRMVSNVNAGDAIAVDYNNFQPFDNFIQLSSISGFAYVIGIEDDESHFELIVSDKESIADPRMLYIGTVPGFPKYLTYVTSFSGFEFLKVGSPVITFRIPTYSSSVTNNTISGFTAAITGGHDYKYAQWRENMGAHRATWIVHADADTDPTIDFDFPQELKAAYPSITKDGLEFSGGAFVRSSGSFTYLDMLAERFKNVRKPEYEMYTMVLK